MAPYTAQTATSRDEMLTGSPPIVLRLLLSGAGLISVGASTAPPPLEDAGMASSCGSISSSASISMSSPPSRASAGDGLRTSAGAIGAAGASGGTAAGCAGGTSAGSAAGGAGASWANRASILARQTALCVP